MKNLIRNAAVVILLLGAVSAARADFNVGVRTDDFYASVGNYDYYPYGVQNGYHPRVSFYDVMSDYGSWNYAQPFGRVWRPYANTSWRPYMYGHWVYTSYGQTWQGYEPWAWVGYHYGNWIMTPQFGWVWVPGYDWHPGRVAWSYGQNEIGWMPAPPVGYDYCNGSLHYHGGYNQFTYNDPDYGYYDNDNYGYNDGYNGGYNGGYDSRYRQLYGGSGYNNISVNLWFFINKDHYGYDNYSNYSLGANHTRDLFSKRAVRVSSAPFERKQLERIVRQRIDETPVDVREIQTEKKSVRLVVPRGEEEHIRKNANRVVKDVIAPGFEKAHKDFRGGENSDKAVAKIFKQQPASKEVKFENNGRDQRVEHNEQFERKEVQRTPEVKQFERKESDRKEVVRQETQRTQPEAKQFERREPQVQMKRPSPYEYKRETPSTKFEENLKKYEADRKKQQETPDRFRSMDQPQRVEPMEKRPSFTPDSKRDFRSEPEVIRRDSTPEVQNRDPREREVVVSDQDSPDDSEKHADIQKEEKNKKSDKNKKQSDKDKPNKDNRH